MEVQYEAILAFKREVLTDMQHADKVRFFFLSFNPLSLLNRSNSNQAKRAYDRGLSIGSLAWQPTVTLPSSHFLELAEQYERRYVMLHQLFISYV